MKLTWQGVKEKEKHIKEYKRQRPGKLNFKVTKQTYIDDIISKHTKKNYPLPGPGSYFLDEKLVKKYHSKNKQLFKVPTKDLKIKNGFGLEKKFKSDKKDKVPGPGHCQPDVIYQLWLLIN